MADSNQTPKVKYIHGHHSSVLRSHIWRTAANSAAYLIPHIQPRSKILDVGCGPGTITCDLAKLAYDGQTNGIDQSDSVLKTARGFAAERNVKNVEFAVGDIYKLDFPDETFDIVHAHQVLQHLADPVKALKEMRRVTKKGGIIASRETDISAAVWYPPHPAMDAWQKCFVKTAEQMGGNPHAGRMHHVFAKKAGFSQEQLVLTADAYCFGSPEDRKFWYEMWADRLEQSSFRDNSLETGNATKEELDEQVKMWRELAKNDDAQFTLVSGQMICRV